MLSFLRREGGGYRQVTDRAGEYAADWTVDGLSRISRRAITRALPRRLRAGSRLRIARELVRGDLRRQPRDRVACAGAARRSTFAARSSAACGSRRRRRLCGFYKAAFARLLARFDLPAALEITSCRGTGSAGCFVAITLMPAASSTREPAMRPDPASEPSA